MKVAVEHGNYDIWLWYHAFKGLPAGLDGGELPAGQVRLGEAGDIIGIGTSSSVSP